MSTTPEPDREPAAVDAALGRVAAVAGAELAGDPRGGGVGQEVEHANAAVSTEPATARPASGRVPRWPTMAVSASR